jgi:hypothetical protein
MPAQRALPTMRIAIRPAVSDDHKATYFRVLASIVKAAAPVLIFQRPA